MAVADCYDYIRKTYRVPAYIGVRVTVHGQHGVLAPMSSHGQYLNVLLDGAKFGQPAHPTDEVRYHIVCNHKLNDNNTCTECGLTP